MLLKRASELSINIRLNEYDRNKIPAFNESGLITILPIKLANQVSPGTPDCSNAKYILDTLDRAIDGCLSNEFSAMVTGPVNKAIINQAGFKFIGHTEYIAEKCNHVFPVMMLMNQSLRVALVTTHIPLSEVSNKISRDLVEQVILIVHRDLISKFRISSPRILICGLNPHAGEQGYLGNEEIDILQPVISKLQQRGLVLVGPVAADTAFTPESLKQKDAVICMYHDQGLPVLKAQGFGEIVNLTLGLPIVRTSVDHGTALELAGKGIANDKSLIAAINCAISLSTSIDRSL
ncbi:MAG: 4-hydroxythreonine-4-phosphate dehydrogenase [Gammaproteobacteria bacterium]|jgi:4-hydroxythreonine-4-phosphate dehydrogenase